MADAPRNTKHGSWPWMAVLFLKKRISCNAERMEWSREALNEVKCCFTITFSGKNVHVTDCVCDGALTT